MEFITEILDKKEVVNGIFVVLGGLLVIIGNFASSYFVNRTNIRKEQEAFRLRILERAYDSLSRYDSWVIIAYQRIGLNIHREKHGRFTFEESERELKLVYGDNPIHELKQLIDIHFKGNEELTTAFYTLLDSHEEYRRSLFNFGNKPKDKKLERKLDAFVLTLTNERIKEVADALKANTPT